MPLPTAAPAKKAPTGKHVASFQPSNAKMKPTAPVTKPTIPLQQPIKRNANALLAAADETDSDDDARPVVAAKGLAGNKNATIPGAAHTLKNHPNQAQKKPTTKPPVKQQRHDKASSDSDEDMVQLGDAEDLAITPQTTKVQGKEHKREKLSTTTASTNNHNNGNHANKLSKQKNAKSTALPSAQSSDDKSSLDDLFSGLKSKPISKNKDKGNASSSSNAETKNKEDDSKTTSGTQPEKDDMNWLGGNDEGRKRTEEGFLIYSYDELGFEEGGDTELCPFDCKCCIA